MPETLMPALDELEHAWIAARDDPGFRSELAALLRDYVGRPSPLYLAARLSDHVGHPIYLQSLSILSKFLLVNSIFFSLETLSM